MVKTNPGPAMSDKDVSGDYCPNLTSSDNSDTEDSSMSKSSGESPAAGSDSETDRTAPWRETLRKEESDSDSEIQPPPPLIPQSAAKVEKKKSNQSSEELRNEGNDLFKKSDYAEAIVKYQEAVDINPDDKNNAAKCYSNIAHCYNKKKDFRKGISNSMKAMASQPDFVRGYSRCSTAYFNMGREFMAALVYLKGLAIIPTSDEMTTALNDLRETHKAKVELAEEHVRVHCKGNAAELDIQAVEKKGYDQSKEKEEREEKEEQEQEEVKEPPKEEKAAVIPDLVASSNDDTDGEDATDVSTELTQSDEGGKPSKMRNKKKDAEGKKKKRRPSAVPNATTTSDEEVPNLEEVEEKKNPKDEAPKKKLKRVKILEEQRKLDDRRQEDEEKKKETKKKKELELKKEAERKEREKKEMETIRKREEEEKLERERRKTDPKEQIKIKFENICKDSSTCLLNLVPKSSMEGYNDALEMINKDYGALRFTSKYKNIAHNEEVVVIKYMYARACGETNNYDCILTGLKRLDEIREQHKPVKFPTVFYGYCNLWKKLNRYDKAVASVWEGIDFLNKGFNVTSYNWPGIPSQLIEETRKDYLSEKLKTLAIELKYPPKPDAICKWTDCVQVQSSSHIVPSENIYVSDPDYKGYYKVHCRLNCQLDYHKSCWMVLKGENIEKLKLTKIPTEKDFFGQPCFTPDCNGIIIKIEIVDENGTTTTLQDNKLIEKLDEEDKKRKEEARIKREREDEEKRVRKLEEKLKKKNREKSSSKKQKEEDENNQTNKKINKPAAAEKVHKHDGTGDSSPVLNIDTEKIPLRVLVPKQKSVEEEDKKANKKKKEKHHDKNTLHWDEFAQGCPNDESNYQARLRKLEAMRESSITQNYLVFAGQNKENHNSLNPSASDFVPVSKEEAAYDEEEIIKESIYSYIYRILKENGPTRLDNAILWKDLDETAKTIIFKNGSTLRGFLMNNVAQFAVFEDQVCIKDHLDQAKRLTEGEDFSRSASPPSPFSLPSSSEASSGFGGGFSSNRAMASGGEAVKQQTSSIITIQDDGFKETFTSGNFMYESMSTKRGSFSSVEGSESSHVSEHKPNLGEVARKMREQIMGKSDTPPPIVELPAQESPKQPTRYHHETDIDGNQVNFANNNNSLGLANEVGKNSILEMIERNAADARNTLPTVVASPVTVSTGAQTDVSSIDMEDLNLDPLTLKQENTSLMVEMQEIKDKLYKIQSERKLELKEMSDKNRITAEDNKKLKMENSSYKDQVAKMKKAVSEATKISDELKKTNETLNIATNKNDQLQTELEETKNRLREELSLSFQLNSQLTRVSHDKATESQTNDLLRAKLLQNEFKKYSEILGQRQANNQRMITHLRGSPELTHIPQVQLALSTLDEFSARLLLAGEELNSQYEALVRQSESSKAIKELNFDISRLEPPNLGPSYLNILHSFIIMSQSSSHPTSAPPPFTAAPPPPISRPSPSASPARHPPSPSINSRATLSPEGIATPSSPVPPPGYTTRPPRLPGSHLLGHSMTGPPPGLGVLPNRTPGLPVLRPQPPISRPTSAPQDPFQAAPATSISHPTQDPIGTRPRPAPSGGTVTSGAPTGRTGKQSSYDKLIAQLQKDHPNLSSQDAQSYIMELRKSNNGKLSGMSIQEIMKKVGTFIERDRGMSGGACAENESCSICFEDMCPTDSRYLNPCRHRFHNDCINKWLESPGGAGSTCPMCRNYIVKEEEFPGLGAARRF